MRRKSSTGNRQKGEKLRPSKGAAVLWDESFLWGIMACRALEKAFLPFELIRSDDVRKGNLRNYRLLFVPGGWSSNKLKALGDDGVREIKKFVRYGGNYLGFCGGAGLATREGIGLLDIGRKSTQERVPSFSGRIRLHTDSHPLWDGVDDPVFAVWWPPQFDVCGDNIHVRASYREAMPDSFSSDLNVGDVEAEGDWSVLEEIYRINLNPARLYGEPAIVEGSYGRGRVLLSLVHFDTPEEPDARTMLQNLWTYLAGTESRADVPDCGADDASEQVVNVCGYMPPPLREMEAAVTDIIEFGIRNFLWFWRNPLLLQWRRGVRGLEYNTLYVMIRSLTEGDPYGAMRARGKQLRQIKERLLPFLAKSRQLLIRERFAMQQGHITFEKCNDIKTQEIRAELFSSSKSYGGLFKEIIDEIDFVLYRVLHG